AEVSELKAEREGARARQRELENARDVAWQAYQVLLKKQAEIEHLQHVKGSEVRLVSEAVPPATPLPQRVAASTVLGAVVGLAIAVAVVAGRVAWHETRRWSEERTPDRMAS